MGPYNPLNKQLEYNPCTGEFSNGTYNRVIRWMRQLLITIFVMIWEKKNKGDCDWQMVSSLDEIPYGEMPKRGSTARFLIDR